MEAITVQADVLLTTAEASQRARVSKRTMETWRLRRQGPAWITLGRAIRYSSAALEKWLTSQTVDPAALSNQ